MAPSILDAEADSRTLEAFLALPRAVYRGDPYHLPGDRAKVLADLRRPAFEGRQRAWLAMDGGAPAARLVARLSPALTCDAGRPLGMLGFFEALNRPGAVTALVVAALTWLRQRGARQVVGPMDGDTWHRYRLNLGPFDDPPFLLEPTNPAYYPALWEKAGFAPLEEHVSKRVEDPAALLHRFGPMLTRVERRGWRLRPLAPERFDEELRLLHRLSLEAFAAAPFFTPIGEADFLALYRGARPLVDPKLVWIAESPHGEAAGFAFAFPDRWRAVAAMKGRRGLLARLRFVLLKGRATAVNFKTLAVLPGHRAGGLGAALMHRVYRAALDKGYRAVNHCLMRQENPSLSLDAGHGRLLRRYALYARALG